MVEMLFILVLKDF